MKLAEYIKSECVNVTEFAKSIGITKNVLYTIMNGSDTLLSIAFLIEKATHGKVKMKDLVSHDKVEKIRSKAKVKKSPGRL